MTHTKKSIFYLRKIINENDNFQKRMTRYLKGYTGDFMGLNISIDDFKSIGRLACLSTIFASLQLLLLTTVAALFYPGGYDYLVSDRYFYDNAINIEYLTAKLKPEFHDTNLLGLKDMIMKQLLMTTKCGSWEVLII